MGCRIKTNVPHNSVISVKETIEELQDLMENKKPVILLTKITTINQNVIEKKIIVKKITVLLIIEE